MAAWTSPQEIRGHAQRMWDDGRVLSARLSGEPLFPFTLRLKVPGPAAIGSQFDEVRQWIRELEQGSRPEGGYGYCIQWRDINHRQVGRNRLPSAVSFEREDDLLRWLGVQAGARRFDQLAAMSLSAFPELSAWMTRYPMLLLRHAQEWPRILAVLQWFRDHPRPGLYLRQLDIPGADTKFIETRRGLIGELLELVLPLGQFNPAAPGARQFEPRFHLLNKPVQVRFRILDPALYIQGLSDIAVPAQQFGALQMKVDTVFITENEINGLTLPDYGAALVVFGGGYGVERLAKMEWLRTRRIVYWGDIDTHGFAILDCLRATLPHAESMMMDAATLEAHTHLWGQEPPAARYMGELTRLSQAEQTLFGQLRQDRFGPCVRLEQERIGFGWVKQAMLALGDGPSEQIGSPSAAAPQFDLLQSSPLTLTKENM